MVQTVSGDPQFLTEWVPEAPSLETKRLRQDADRFAASGAETKNEWPYTSTPQAAFIACTGTTFKTAFQLRQFSSVFPCADIWWAYHLLLE
jgi:hypothetical protein